MKGEEECQGERERGRRRERSPKENIHGTWNREKVKTRYVMKYRIDLMVITIEYH